MKLPDSFVTRNAATTLEFHLLRTLEAGSRYIIAIHTKMGGTYELKTAVTGYSKITVMKSGVGRMGTAGDCDSHFLPDDGIAGMGHFPD